MGYEGPRHSFIIRILGRFLSSPRDTFLSSPKYWEKHYTVGVLYPQVLNEIERYAVLKLKDFNVPSFYCRYLEGYFSCLLQYQFPNRTVRSEEVRCINKGDPYHEFRFTW
ncbi:MAG: hypothetical protein ABIL05_03955 [candidate division WOR-3 bacterium]